MGWGERLPGDFRTLGSLTSIAITLAGAVALSAVFLARGKPSRQQTIPHTTERVLIIGASSGIGRCIALEYASRGARVCIVARREPELVKVKAECEAAHPDTIQSSHILHVQADYTKPEDLINVQSVIQKEWGGLDTLIVNAGVSALKPLMLVADAQPSDDSVTIEGLKKVEQAAGGILAGNYMGPLLSVVSFIPMLTMTSLKPAILQTSSLAAVIPAPTRTLYTSTKAAALMLYRSLSIEHPRIQFSMVLPSTVDGDFRKSAVDKGPVLESTRGMMKPEVVAKACIKAVDRGQRTVFLPSSMSMLPYLYLLAPERIERLASKKYNFVSQ